MLICNLDQEPSQRPPEFLLWREVLQHAIDDIDPNSTNFLDIRDPRQIRRIRERARYWFLSTADGPGSFEWICETLNLSPRRTSRDLQARASRTMRCRDLASDEARGTVRVSAIPSAKPVSTSLPRWRLRTRA